MTARDFAAELEEGARNYRSSVGGIPYEEESKKDSLLQRRKTNNDFFTEYYMRQREEIAALKKSNLDDLKLLQKSDKQFHNNKYMSDLSDGEALGNEAMYKLDSLPNDMMTTFMKRLNITKEQAAGLVGNANYETMGFTALQEIEHTSGEGGWNLFQFTE